MLFSGEVYEPTVKDMRRGFSQSQTAFLPELSSIDHVKNHVAIKMWIAPPAAYHTESGMNNIPTNEELFNAGWKENFVGYASQRNVNVRGGMRETRQGQTYHE